MERKIAQNGPIVMEDDLSGKHQHLHKNFELVSGYEARTFQLIRKGRRRKLALPQQAPYMIITDFS